MRILQVHNRYTQPGGEDQSTTLEAEALARAGVIVHQARAENPTGKLQQTVGTVASIHNPRSVGWFNTLLDKVEPDLVHFHNTWFRLSPGIIRAAHLRTVPTVLTLRNSRLFCVSADFSRNGDTCLDCLGGSRLHGVVHGCYKGSRTLSTLSALTYGLHDFWGTWRQLSAVITPSVWMQTIAQRAGVNDNETFVVPNMCNDPGTRQQLPSRSNVVVVPGRLTEEKGVIRLANAWLSRQDSLSNLQLCFIGNGPERSRLASLGDPSIKVMSWIDHPSLLDYLLSARAVLCPSVSPESFGRTAIEGMAAAAPVFVSGAGALPELVSPVSDRLIGSTMSEGRIHSWLEPLGDDSFVDYFGYACRNHYDSTYTPEVVTKQLLHAYASIV